MNEGLTTFLNILLKFAGNDIPFVIRFKDAVYYKREIPCSQELKIYMACLHHLINKDVISAAESQLEAMETVEKHAPNLNDLFERKRDAMMREMGDHCEKCRALWKGVHWKGGPLSEWNQYIDALTYLRDAMHAMPFCNKREDLFDAREMVKFDDDYHKRLTDFKEWLPNCPADTFICFFEENEPRDLKKVKRGPIEDQPHMAMVDRFFDKLRSPHYSPFKSLLLHKKVQCNDCVHVRDGFWSHTNPMSLDSNLNYKRRPL